jgi:hypothetical protein
MCDVMKAKKRERENGRRFGMFFFLVDDEMTNEKS